MKYDCIIIGGGFSGLAAACRLSHFGKKTVLIERNPTLGGLNSYYFRKGVEIDTGLHAMTNYCGDGSHKSLPLNRLLRQLRIGRDELELREQKQSEIRFQDRKILFGDNFDGLVSAVADEFPGEADGFLRLDAAISRYDPFSLDNARSSAREFVAGHIGDRTLADMIFCPLMYYGSAVENDMDMYQFAIMFRSIFHEGFCRPSRGIKSLLDLLEKKLADNGCEIRRNTAVAEILVESGAAAGVRLGNGEIVRAGKILSCAGMDETLNLCGNNPQISSASDRMAGGRMTFAELIICLKEGFSLGEYGNACLFFNRDAKFDYSPPRVPYSLRSGVFCCPGNFRFLAGEGLRNQFLRLTVLAGHERWFAACDSEYSEMKEQFRADGIALARELSGLAVGDADMVFTDIYTPRTICRWAGKIDGAIYGSPRKTKDGTTAVGNLFVCGTDQGFLGITGSMLSGISMANLHILQDR